MRYAVPVHYSVRGVREGRLRESTAAITEIVAVDIEEVEASAAPIAASWAETLPLDHLVILDDEEYPAPRPYETDGPHAHTRFYDGQHWIPCAGTETGLPWADYLEAREFLKRRSGAPGNALDPRTVSAKWTATIREAEKHARDGRGAFARVVNSSRDGQREAALVIASQRLLVDGRMYRRCAEPFLWLSRVRDMRHGIEEDEVAILRVGVGVGTGYDNSAIDNWYYPFAEADEACMAATAFHAGSPAGPAADALNGSVLATLHLPYAHDPELHVMRRIHDIGMRVVVEEVKSDMPIPQTAELLDALQPFRTAAHLERVEGIFNDLAADPEMEGHPLIDLIRSGLELLDARPVDLADVRTAGLRP